MAILGVTGAMAAVTDYEAVAGGEMASEMVQISGDPNGFTAAGLEWTVTTTVAPATGDANQFDFLAFTTLLEMTMIEQVFAPSSYTGVYQVTTDPSGLWGGFALVEVSGGLDGFGPGNLKVTEAALKSTPPVIPLPAGGLLLLSGLAGLSLLRRNRAA